MHLLSCDGVLISLTPQEIRHEQDTGSGDAQYCQSVWQILRAERGRSDGIPR
ncbi:hypothetical protein CKO_03791 [Citrobacter koseri ATCC BAA-895]|uniref:Uncharacterized protein n=1 Tax=Citrobacter koseri (strain ATCC BAA-895 / CDC 4225-83 / SGSC4696) TaxID=290338 RepID=A8AN04_CITK8|nr:hypothetical protein CKO_03791 [Citrobacter koseri ATCC BAA-895]